MLLPRKWKVLFSLILWRTISVYVVQTAHVPDEYWQSLEVAHRLVFGYGYLTWEWIAGIRSYIYPFLISILYRILAVLSLDNVTLLTTLPRLLQAVISAYGDYRFYEWTKNKFMLFSLCTNWYWYYCASRTLINSFESTCTIIALSVFPWRDSHNRSIKFFWIVGLISMARPTAAILWMPLCLYHLCTSQGNKLILMFQYIGICGSCFLFSVLLDSYCYGRFVISPWEFFYANVLHKVGDSYGKEHIFWYLFSGLPVLLMLHYVGFLVAAWQVVKHPSHFHKQSVMLITVGWTIGLYSLLSHKEFRFLLPLLPMLLYVSLSCTSYLNVKFSELSRRTLIGILVVNNLLPGIYFSLIHQRGSLDVMKVLQKELISSDYASTDVLFLTPCHATPLYSHLHINVPIRFLTCNPNFKNSVGYLDEADQFFADPMLWLNARYLSKNVTLPSYVITFDNTAFRITEFLKGYKPVDKVFHAHFPQSNYGKYFMVYKHVELG